MEGFIQDIRVHNVVQIITDNAASYVVVGKMLMERHSIYFALRVLLIVLI